ncbi:hypothetical protein ACFWXA_28280 [Streptomyces atroolivaceus]
MLYPLSYEGGDLSECVVMFPKVDESIHWNPDSVPVVLLIKAAPPLTV